MKNRRQQIEELDNPTNAREAVEYILTMVGNLGRGELKNTSVAKEISNGIGKATHAALGEMEHARLRKEKPNVLYFSAK